MKVVGYGWIKTGETLGAAMKRYGVPAKLKPGKATIIVEKSLFKHPDDARKDFRERVQNKENRKSAKPRFFRVVLQEL